MLEDLLESEEIDAKVYIKPPSANAMKYPCIIASRDVGNTKFADNVPYRHTPRYQLKAIYEGATSPLYAFLASLPTSVHNRSYPADNLNHDVFTISFQEESE
jgi:hypothetical protein